MRCRAKVAFTTVHGKIAVGTIVNIPDNLLEKYKDRVEPVSVSISGDGRDLDHYCKDGACWCSEKLPGSNHPLGCIRHGCCHHQDAPHHTNAMQGIPTLASKENTP